MLKLHCMTCGTFIKEVEPKKVSDLTGSEVCADCGNRINEAFKEIETLRVNVHKEASSLCVEAQENLQATMKLRDRTKHQANLLIDKVKAELEQLSKNIMKKGK